MDTRRYGDLEFDEGFATARRGSAEELVFTRAERLLLSALVGNANRVLTRDQLLAAISSPDSDVSDRNVDFVVNRLRTKLKDPARTPRFIATRYGEGYVWIAAPAQPAEALLVIGPVHGLARTGALGPLATALLNELLKGFQASTSPDQHIRLDERFSPSAFQKTLFSLEVSLYPRGLQLHSALVLRRATGGEVIGTSRLVVSDARDVSRSLAGVLKEFRSLMWRKQVLSVVEAPTSSAPPVYVAMHDAGRLLTASNQSWLESIDQVRAALEASPQDPQIRLMWGLSLYVQVIMGTGGQILPDEQRIPIEDEIEEVALGALPAVAGNPMLKLSAAKLLLFLGRGYTALAERLADEAFEHSTAFAAAFAILGQARLARGRLAEGMDLLERGLEMAEPGTEFAIYIMVLMCGGKLAAEDHEGLVALLAHLNEVAPVTRVTVSPFCVLADRPLSSQDRAFLAGLGPERARRGLDYIHMTSARHYEDVRYQRNVLNGLAYHLERLYGPEVISEHVRAILDSEDQRQVPSRPA